MIYGNKILAIIPSRSGSKEIKDKNIVKVNGIPLINYSIIFAKKMKFIDKILVSTDSEKYQKIINKLGNFSKFLRPSEISKDNSLDIEFIKHSLNWLRKNENFIPDLILHLRPSSPMRKIRDIKNALSIIANQKKIDSIKSISLINNPVEKIWLLKKNFLLKPIFKRKKFKEPHNMPRQLLNNCYKQNALFDIYRTKIVLKKKVLHGEKIFGYITKENIDIDDRYDLKKFKNKIKSLKNFEKYISN